MSLLDELGGTALAALRPNPLDRLDLASALFALAYRYASLLQRALARSRSLPPLIELAALLVMSCREAEPVSQTLDFLTSLARGVRLGPSGADAAVREAVRMQLQAALGGAAGEGLVREPWS